VKEGKSEDKEAKRYKKMNGNGLLQNHDNDYVR